MFAGEASEVESFCGGGFEEGFVTLNGEGEAGGEGGDRGEPSEGVFGRLDGARVHRVEGDFASEDLAHGGYLSRGLV